MALSSPNSPSECLSFLAVTIPKASSRPWLTLSPVLPRLSGWLP